METIWFESALVVAVSGELTVIALFDGALEHGEQPHRCVGLLMCAPETARALAASLGSELNA